MKTKTFLALGLIILSGACNSGNSAADAYFATLDQLTPEQKMSGRKTRLLYGDVSKVTRSDGCFMEFNKDGNLTKAKDRPDGDVTEYKYVNPKRYFLFGDPYNIIYNDSMRTEEWDNAEKLNTHYIFDEKGRLKQYGIRDYYSCSEYFYYKDDALLPFKIETITGDEGGQTTTTSLYTYTKTDEKGNWLECKVKTTVVSEESRYDPIEDKETVTTTESPAEHVSYSRTIEYFPGDDPDDAADSSREPAAFQWPPKKYPCNVPFKLLKQGNREFAWNIESVTCTGREKDKSGYTFIVRGTGVKDSRNYSMGSRGVTFVPEEKGSRSIDMSMAAAYILPGTAAGENFELEFKGLFTGYYHEDLFVGFLILDR
ncbi:MAG: hypothetical protein LBP64_05535 [Tannerella sp.]|jgi:hypothetical protein|nr:hypothetical protein [Tannerella sp.]